MTRRRITRCGATGRSRASSTGEFAAPVTRAWGLAYVAFSWVPLHARHVVEAEGFTDFEGRPRRLCRLLARYRWDGDARDLIPIVQERAQSMAEGLRELVRQGTRKPFVWSRRG